MSSKPRWVRSNCTFYLVDSNQFNLISPVRTSVTTDHHIFRYIYIYIDSSRSIKSLRILISSISQIINKCLFSEFLHLSFILPFTKRASKDSQYVVSEILKRRILQKNSTMSKQLSLVSSLATATLCSIGQNTRGCFSNCKSHFQ